jgi:hypothetical protein
LQFRNLQPHADGRQALIQPHLGLTTGGYQYEGAQLSDDADSFGHRKEQVGTHHPSLRMVPADQRFDARDLSAADHHWGLIDENGALLPWSEPGPLRFKHLLDLSDLLLDFASDLFCLTFVREVGIVRNLSGLFFHFAFQLMKRAVDLVFRAWFQLDSPSLVWRSRASLASVDAIRGPRETGPVFELCLPRSLGAR